MKTIGSIMLAASIIACASSSGSSHPSGQDTVNQFVTAYCQALIPCCTNGMLACASGFTESQCEQDLKTTVSGTEACTNDQVNACLADIKNQSCSALTPSMIKLPSSCSSC